MQLRFFTILIMLLLSSNFMLTAKAYADEEITFIYISRLADIQTQQEKSGLSSVATILKELRAEEEAVIFIHGGNALGLSPLSTFDKGAHMVGLLNYLEPSVMAVGRRDFTHKEDELELRARAALFTMVCSNMVEHITKEVPSGLAAVELINVSNYTIAFIALTSPEVSTSYLQTRYKAIGGFEILPELAKKLKAENVDYIFVLADFEPENPAQVLAGSEVDALLINALESTELTLKGGKIYGIQGDTKFAFKIDATLIGNEHSFKPKKLMVTNLTIINLDEVELDPDMVSEMNIYMQSLDALLNLPVGKILTPIDTSRVLVRSAENAFANLVVDALRGYHLSDIAIFNGGGIRGNKSYNPPIEFTRRDLQTEFPIQDECVLLEIKGEQLKDILEHGIDGIADLRGRFLHVAGLSYSFDLNKERGSRVSDILVDGKVLELDKLYSLSTSSFLAAGGDGYDILATAKHITTSRSTQTLVELLQVYISKNSPVSPKIEGRIKNITAPAGK